MSKGKTVWILGAGFSALMGAPMLPQLISAARVYEAALYDAKRHSRRSDTLRIYQEGLAEGHWSNAEEFLTVASRADYHQGAQQLLARLKIGPSHSFHTDDMRDIAREVARDATLTIAYACSTFMYRVHEEQWTPYEHWVKQLDKNDSIVTFNYDIVVEEAFDKATLAAPRIVGIRGQQKGTVHLHKLHGSVDWVQEHVTKPIKRERQKPRGIGIPGFELSEKLVLGTPGGNKYWLTRRLQPVWDAAMARIREASAVVFIGYRFPETDVDSIMQLHTAIRQNRKTPHAWIVLGPGESADAIRQERLLTSSGLRGRVHNTRFFSQDLLTLYRREANEDGPEALRRVLLG
jgi:SIR2-like domain